MKKYSLVERVFTPGRVKECPLHNLGSCGGNLANSMTAYCGDGRSCVIKHWLAALIEESAPTEVAKTSDADIPESLAEELANVADPNA